MIMIPQCQSKPVGCYIYETFKNKTGLCFCYFIFSDFVLILNPNLCPQNSQHINTESEKRILQHNILLWISLFFLRAQFESSQTISESESEKLHYKVRFLHIQGICFGVVSACHTFSKYKKVNKILEKNIRI